MGIGPGLSPCLETDYIDPVLGSGRGKSLSLRKSDGSGNASGSTTGGALTAGGCGEAAPGSLDNISEGVSASVNHV